MLDLKEFIFLPPKKPQQQHLTLGLVDHQLASNMSMGDIIVPVNIIKITANYYMTQFTIDGAVTERWNGGSAPSSGNSTGYDVYTYTIIKTRKRIINNDFIVLVNTSNYAG